MQIERVILDIWFVGAPFAFGSPSRLSTRVLEQMNVKI